MTEAEGPREHPEEDEHDHEQELEHERSGHDEGDEDDAPLAPPSAGDNFAESGGSLAGDDDEPDA